MLISGLQFKASPAYNRIVLEAVIARLMRANYGLDTMDLDDSNSPVSQAIIKGGHAPDTGKIFGAITSSNSRISLILNLYPPYQPIPGSFTQPVANTIIPFTRSYTIVAAVSDNYQTDVATFTATLIFSRFQQHMMRKNITTAGDGEPNWHSLILWSLLHECMDWALPTLTQDIWSLCSRVLTDEQLLSLRPRLILTMADAHIVNGASSMLDKCRGRCVVMYVYTSPDHTQHQLINRTILRYFLGEEQLTRTFNISGLRGVATRPVSQQFPHSFHATAIPLSMARSPSYFLLRLEWIPAAITPQHLLTIMEGILQLVDITGILDEYDKSNNQGSSLVDRDTPSRTILFSSPEALAYAYSIRPQLVHAIDTLWHQRRTRCEGYDLLPELDPRHFQNTPPAPTLGVSNIVVTSVNQLPTSPLPTVTLPYEPLAPHVPITANVTLAFLLEKLKSPQGEWLTTQPPTLPVQQMNLLRAALSTVAQMCNADPTNQAINQLTTTLEHVFLQEDSVPRTRQSLITWCSAVTQHFHKADGGVANADDSDTQDMEDGC